LVQLAACLRLDYEFVVNKQIQALDSESRLVVQDPDGNFSSYPMASAAELLLHCFDVKVLKEPVSERIVNLEKRPNRGMRKPFFKQLDTRHAFKIAPANRFQVIISPREESSAPDGMIRSIA
jgi:hypothetical protein